jgi:hypothetical protein
MQVIDNIMEAIYKSKRTVVVMSTNFLTSVWGAFELEHVQHRLITMVSHGPDNVGRKA